MAARSGRRRGTDTAGDQARAAIIDATVASLAEDGFSATSARAVADRAGIASGGVFYHFGSMDKLLAAVFDQCLDQRIARMRPILDAPPAELPDALRDAVSAEFANPMSRALLEVVVGAASSPGLAGPVRQGVDRSFAFTRQIVDRLVEGTPLAAILPLDLVAQIAASAFFGLAVLDLVGSDIDVDGMTALVVALTRLGVGSPGAHAQPEIRPTARGRTAPGNPGTR